MRGCLRCSVDGSLARGDNETPLLESTPDLGFNTATGVIPWFLYMPFCKKGLSSILQIQMGSLAGAAHLSKDNAGVLR